MKHIVPAKHLSRYFRATDTTKDGSVCHNDKYIVSQIDSNYIT